MSIIRLAVKATHSSISDNDNLWHNHLIYIFFPCHCIKIKLKRRTIKRKAFDIWFLTTNARIVTLRTVFDGCAANKFNFLLPHRTNELFDNFVFFSQQSVSQVYTIKRTKYACGCNTEKNLFGYERRFRLTFHICGRIDNQLNSHRAY